MKVYGGVDVYINVFFTSALVGGEWSASGLSRFTPGTHLIGGWMGPRTGLDDVEWRKFFFQDSNPDPSAVSIPIAPSRLSPHVG
jgi:hypothetical protein